MFWARNNNTSLGFAIGSLIGIIISLYLSCSNLIGKLEDKQKFIYFLGNKVETQRHVPEKHDDLQEYPNPDLDTKIVYGDVGSLEPLDGVLTYMDALDPKKAIKRAKIFCYVLTTPRFHKLRAIHVKQTWGRRCDKLVFFSSKEDKSIGAIGLPVPDAYNYLWGKSRAALEYIYQKYLDEGDWFIKADDDTYVIVDNLRSFVKDYDSNKPHVFGCTFQVRNKTSYMSGGAGYVMSKRTVVQVVEEAFPDPEKCKDGYYGYEDIEIAKCMRNVGIMGDDSRDKYGRYRFLALSPRSYVVPGLLGKTAWWWKFIKYSHHKGQNCCSPLAITFHYISPEDMYVFEFFLYHLVRPKKDIGAKSRRIARKHKIPPIVLHTRYTTKTNEIQDQQQQKETARVIRKKNKDLALQSEQKSAIKSIDSSLKIPDPEPDIQNAILNNNEVVSEITPETITAATLTIIKSISTKETPAEEAESTAEFDENGPTEKETDPEKLTTIILPNLTNHTEIETVVDDALSIQGDVPAEEEVAVITTTTSTVEMSKDNYNIVYSYRNANVN